MNETKPVQADNLRIVMIAPTPFFADRGCHIRILGEAKALIDLGHELILCTYFLGRDIEAYPLCVPCLFRGTTNCLPDHLGTNSTSIYCCYGESSRFAVHFAPMSFTHTYTKESSSARLLVGFFGFRW